MMTERSMVTGPATTSPATTGGAVSVRRRGYRLMAGLLVVTMLGGTLPIPLYVLYGRQLCFGPLGVTVVFAAYVIGTLSALVMFGDLSDHIGRRKVLAVGVCRATRSSRRRSRRSRSWCRSGRSGSSDR